MSDLLALGLSGLTAYRTALAAVGDNVANAETPGYARRTIRLAETMGGTSQIPYYRDNSRFGGVTAVGVQRAWDMFKAAEARHAAASTGHASVRAQWLSTVETALDDGPAGVGARLTNFFNAADRLATNPTDTLNRSQMLLSLEDTAGAFRTTGNALSRIASSTSEAAGLDVTNLNQSLTALADINRTLLTAAPGSTTRASLEDQRDLLIDKISANLDVQVSLNDRGAATLTMTDAPGSTLIGIGETASFAVTQASDGRLSVQLTNNSGTAAITPVTGRIAGYIEASNVIADRRAALDTLATDFATQINSWSAGGLDAAGNPGPPLLDATGGAVGITSLVTDPARVAAASTDGRPNGNLLALSALRGDGGVEKRWTGMVAGHAQQLAAARSQAAAAAAWQENAYAALDETTGIDLDREAADLLRFQQAYSACARIIQVGRETFDTLLKSV